jgi:alpha-galactosidase
MSGVSWFEQGIHLELSWSDEHPVRLLHLSPLAFDASLIAGDAAHRFNLVELAVTGQGSDEHHGLKHMSERPSASLRYLDHREERNARGRLLVVRQIEPGLGLEVSSHLQFYDGIPAVSSWTEVKNTACAPVGLEYVSSFCLSGLCKEAGDFAGARVHLAHNAWCNEAQWRSAPLCDFGIAPVAFLSTQRISVANTGAWSCLGYLPMGAFEMPGPGTTLLWQIEHNGSWQWEISDIGRSDLYLKLSGPTEQESSWYKRLLPGEAFQSVPCAVCAVKGGFEEALQQMTRYRRAVRRDCPDNHALPVVFNEMPQFDGNADTKSLEPVIDAAAAMGAEVFCIDAGWYTDGWWWNGIGPWTPSTKKHPDGLGPSVRRILDRGMAAGIWLELEVMSVDEHADRLPDDWFFMRHGRRVVNHGRYQLDFRNPAVRAFADSVIDRLVETGFTYFKLDYNIESGMGTELGADSLGDGLLGHSRAVLAFQDGVLLRHPNLSIENCCSGGLRMDWAMVGRSAVQSFTDQSERDKLAILGAAAVSAMPPEQCLAWCLPFPGTRAQAVFSLVSSMLIRPCIGGDIALFAGEDMALTRAAIECYKRIRADIPGGLPFYPLGMPRMGDDAVAFGLALGGKAYLSVMRIRGEGALTLPLPAPAQTACVLFPPEPLEVRLDRERRAIELALPDGMAAALIELI